MEFCDNELDNLSLDELMKKHANCGNSDYVVKTVSQEEVAIQINICLMRFVFRGLYKGYPLQQYYRLYQYCQMWKFQNRLNQCIMFKLDKMNVVLRNQG